MCIRDRFGQGAVALGNGSPVGFVPTEVDRDKKKGSGVDYLINRRTNILHPRGVAFTAKSMEHMKEGPSRAEVADPKNWKPVYDPKPVSYTHLDVYKRQYEGPAR